MHRLPSGTPAEAPGSRTLDSLLSSLPGKNGTGPALSFFARFWFCNPDSTVFPHKINATIRCVDLRTSLNSFTCLRNRSSVSSYPLASQRFCDHSECGRRRCRSALPCALPNLRPTAHHREPHPHLHGLSGLLSTYHRPHVRLLRPPVHFQGCR